MRVFGLSACIDVSETLLTSNNNVNFLIGYSWQCHYSICKIQIGREERESVIKMFYPCVILTWY